MTAYTLQFCNLTTWKWENNYPQQKEIEITKKLSTKTNHHWINFRKMITNAKLSKLDGTKYLVFMYRIKKLEKETFTNKIS